MLERAVWLHTLTQMIDFGENKQKIFAKLLKIDVTKHNKGLDIHENSPYDEKEILLSPGTKLKITDVVYNSNKDYFKISCVPV